MYPICADVELASLPLTSGRTRIAAVPATAVSPPTTTSPSRTPGAAANTGQSRIASSPMPLTTPACSSAETGEGASAVSGNHRHAGTSADRTIPASASSAGTSHPAAATSLRNPMPSMAISRTAAHSAASPMSNRPATRLLALRAAGVPECATRPAMAKPLAVQPSAMSAIGSATTASHSAVMAVASSAAYRPCRVWPRRFRAEYAATSQPIVSTKVPSSTETALK